MTQPITPLRAQYLEIKRQYPDCILLFRLGDFYETFDADAEIAARELDLVLTSRPTSKTERVPMAGVPYHAVDNYIARLIEKGYHVAVCEQVTEPNGRGLVEREVTRVVTPGTITEPELLAEDRHNYLMAIFPVGDETMGAWNQVGVAYADITTGDFAVTQISGEDAGVRVTEEIARLSPREVLLPEAWANRGATMPNGVHLTAAQDWRFERANAFNRLTEHFRARTLDGFGIGDMPAAICAAGGLLDYLYATQRGQLAQITRLRPYTTADFMVLDPFTRRNLELTETIRSREARGSLLGVLDRTTTPMGARLLREWISQPLLDLRRLNARLDAVEAISRDELLRHELRDLLKTISDLERLTNRLLIARAIPRELMALRQTLETVPVLRERIGSISALSALVDRLDPCDDAVALIARAIADEPPTTLDKMGVIRAGYSDELDDVIQATQDAREWIASLEPRERRRTGIATLKVGFNKVFGYYIEITHANTAKVPDDYERKQTLVNAERYITPELKEYETLVLNAEQQILDIERRLFDEVCRALAVHSERLLKTAKALAHLDAFLSLAEVAAREGYTRPLLTEDDLLVIKAGRHPVVEKLMESGVRYVANDTHFDSMSRIHIITGPNMSGKSTYIRQVAIITLMAQIGSFVPADEATIGLVDRIFARIGAQDEIHAGYSTFMVEMIETARLLSGSTRRSLLILDEVGRGTSTYDGLAIARAVIEFIHNNPRLNCRTLFATHYHELTELPEVLPRARNFNVAVAEQGDEVIFLHRVIVGGADRSYGVHVAQIAGMPRPVVDRARELLRTLEEQGSDFELPTKKKRRQNPAQLSFIDDAPHPTLTALKAMDVDALSPIEALTKLYELKKMAMDS
ncbi:MAG: DNA mismatch repair protein MutS [Anaerolineae bacterium]|nr:DNA mismatch repair protein MutS [Anaerolineae bacterium]NUQ05682.1 DNA mismatch repair protein MutS [Anaerolineae bacterium]